MRWTKLPAPELGDKRIQTKFLLTPQTINLETRWLETATWEEEYIRDIVGTEYWSMTRWAY